MKHEDLLKLEAEKRKELEDIKKQIKYYEHRARLIAHIQDLDASLEQEKKRLHEFRVAETSSSNQNDMRPFFTLTLLYFINSGHLEQIHRYRFSGSYIGAYLGKQDSSSTLFATNEQGKEIYINSLKSMTDHYPPWDSLQQDWADVFRTYDWTEESHTALKGLLDYIVHDTAMYAVDWHLKEAPGLNRIYGGFNETKKNTERTVYQSKDVHLPWQHDLRMYMLPIPPSGV